MTDAPHPDLAGLSPAPLEPAERMEAAAARARNMSTLPGPVPWPMRHSMAGMALTFETGAKLHRRSGDGACEEERRDGVCTVLRLADALLGNPL